MARKQFRLERILDWKSNQEKMMKLEKSIVEKKAMDTGEEIKKCLNKIDDLALTAFKKVRSGVLVRDMITISSNLRHINKTIHSLQLDLKDLMAKIEDLNTEILEVSRMKKVLAKLQERFRIEEMGEELRREIKLLDEIGARQSATKGNGKIS
jgi:flagellar export protein FliJ